MSETSSHNNHDHGFAHPIPVRLLIGVFLCLVGLTILTVVVNDLPLGNLDIWIALIIATIKASLVLLFFMHMYWEKGINIVAFFTSLLFVALFIGLALMDTGANRDSQDSYGGPLPAVPVPVFTAPADGTGAG